jgi:hypothetical protein
MGIVNVIVIFPRQVSEDSMERSAYGHFQQCLLKVRTLFSGFMFESLSQNQLSLCAGKLFCQRISFQHVVISNSAFNEFNPPAFAIERQRSTLIAVCAHRRPPTTIDRSSRADNHCANVSLKVSKVESGTEFIIYDKACHAQQKISNQTVAKSRGQAFADLHLIFTWIATMRKAQIYSNAFTSPHRFISLRLQVFSLRFSHEQITSYVCKSGVRTHICWHTDRNSITESHKTSDSPKIYAETTVNVKSKNSRLLKSHCFSTG